MTDTAATEMIHSLVPLCVTLGITADTAGPNEVVLSLDWAPNLSTGNDVLHGGIVMALADSSGAVCAFLNLPGGRGRHRNHRIQDQFLRRHPLRHRQGAQPPAAHRQAGHRGRNGDPRRRRQTCRQNHSVASGPVISARAGGRAAR